RAARHARAALPREVAAARALQRRPALRRDRAPARRRRRRVDPRRPALGSGRRCPLWLQSRVPSTPGERRIGPRPAGGDPGRPAAPCRGRVNRILVINVARIGDTLLTTPALRALAAKWPRARITFLGHPKRVEVMEHLPFLAATGGITKHRARWRGRLPGARWDLALVLGFDQELVAYALRVASHVVAFRQGNPRLDARLRHCVEPPAAQSQHGALMQLLLTRALGISDAGLRLS